MSLIDPHEHLDKLTKHLGVALLISDRGADFDLDDTPESEFLTFCPELSTAFSWLTENVTLKWRKADEEALKSQQRHRWLARIALTMGTAAIVLAVVQLSIKLTASRFAMLTLTIEAVAVGAAFLAVIIGITTKADRRWLGKRHLAERLRMLKFRALEQLFCKDREAWQTWVEQQLEQLGSADDFTSIKKWSKAGEIEPAAMKSRDCSAELAEALTIYYRYKRLEFQGNYFKNRAKIYLRQANSWRRLNLPVFLTSVCFVLAHFVAEWFAHKAEISGNKLLAEDWGNAAVWCVALAAIIPIIGGGVRAWFAAFQVPLSASLYAAKYQALQRAITHLKETSGDIQATVDHITQYEHFLEHEHRDWLRLLLETEWFI